MDKIISLILDGCKLSKDLESSLQNLANQPDTLLKLCDEIIRVFMVARESLNTHQMLFRERQQSQQLPIDPNLQLQEWLRTSSTSAMDQLLQMQQMVAATNLLQGKGVGTEMGSSSGGLVMELGGRDDQVIVTSDSGRGSSSSSQRQRRRNDDAKKRMIRVPVPRIGNTEIPPEDGFTWRKYGQKEILGSKFPRSYYRCTHQKLYQCPAKKQVQRLDNDPYTFEVTYRGDHTCHMSATAPSIAPPEITRDITQIVTTQAPPSVSLGRWLEFSLGAGGSGSSSSSMAAGGGGGHAGPSNIRYGKEVDYPVTDMADALFNAGSSSSNSMEFIFTPMEDKEELGDKKN